MFEHDENKKERAEKFLLRKGGLDVAKFCEKNKYDFRFHPSSSRVCIFCTLLTARNAPDGRRELVPFSLFSQRYLRRILKWIIRFWCGNALSKSRDCESETVKSTQIVKKQLVVASGDFTQREYNMISTFRFAQTDRNSSDFVTFWTRCRVLSSQPICEQSTWTNNQRYTRELAYLSWL